MQIAVLIPCYNEEQTIARVVVDFHEYLPAAKVFVCDNNSTDGTESEARRAGARVIHESQRGKGHAVRRLFSDVSADVFVLVDGDATYDASAAPDLVKCLVDRQLDMLVASRMTSFSGRAFPGGRHWGNRVLRGFLNFLFGASCKDVLSGYRVMSRRFVKSFPALATGFETEIELTVHALSLKMPMAEVSAAYGERPENSHSKLNTWRDGWRIFLTILSLLKSERPLLFFSSVFVFLVGLSLALGYPVITEYLRTGLVPRFPTAILATGIMLLAFMSLTAGFVLDNVTRGRREMKRLFYLREPAPGGNT